MPSPPEAGAASPAPWREGPGSVDTTPVGCEDLTLDRPYKRRDSGRKVKLIQEWLCLHGFHVRIDGDFGPATETALTRFQREVGLPVTATVDALTFERLTAPMRAALAPIVPEGRSASQMVVAYARQHLRQHPREVGGRNRGPWVRLYMGGNEGEPWAWSAGFVCLCLDQACRTLDLQLPLELSYSCDSLAASAKAQGRFLSEPPERERARVTPGSIFLNSRSPLDWRHAGVVVRAAPEVIQTIEGNVADEGLAEGYEVCERTRGYRHMDFIVM
jgi:hypothetical protein